MSKTFLLSAPNLDAAGVVGLAQANARKVRDFFARGPGGCEMALMRAQSVYGLSPGALKGLIHKAPKTVDALVFLRLEAARQDIERQRESFAAHARTVETLIAQGVGCKADCRDELDIT